MQTGTKMILGFAVIAKVTLAVGAMGYCGIITVRGDLEETETNILPKIQYSLVVKKEQNVLNAAQKTIPISRPANEEKQLEIIRESPTAQASSESEKSLNAAQRRSFGKQIPTKQIVAPYDINPLYAEDGF